MVPLLAPDERCEWCREPRPVRKSPAPSRDLVFFLAATAATDESFLSADLPPESAPAEIHRGGVAQCTARVAYCLRQSARAGPGLLVHAAVSVSPFFDNDTFPPGHVTDAIGLALLAGEVAAAVLALFLPHDGEGARSGGPGGSWSARVALGPLRSLRSRRPLLALRALRTLRSGNALITLRALWSRRPLLPFRALRTGGPCSPLAPC